MHCEKCGTYVSENAKFCHKCGESFITNKNDVTIFEEKANTNYNIGYLSKYAPMTVLVVVVARETISFLGRVVLFLYSGLNYFGPNGCLINNLAYNISIESSEIKEYYYVRGFINTLTGIFNVIVMLWIVSFFYKLFFKRVDNADKQKLKIIMFIPTFISFFKGVFVIPFANNYVFLSSKLGADLMYAIVYFIAPIIGLIFVCIVSYFLSRKILKTQFDIDD